MSPTASSATEPILVTGATGDVGQELTTLLAGQHASIRVMCRRREQLKDFEKRGMEAVLASFEDRASMRSAMDGCAQLFLVSPAVSNQLDLDRNAIDSAQDAGIRHVVKISTADANVDSRVPWARDLARSDAYLHDSGLAWTCLHPGSFMKNLLFEASAIKRGWLPQTSGHGATAWVDVTDIAAVAARVLTDSALQGSTGNGGRRYLLTGTPATSYPEIARMLTDELPHRVRYLHMPAPLLYTALRLAGTARWQARGLIHQYVDVVRRGHDNVRVTSTDIERILGRQPVGIREFIRHHRAEFT